MKNNQTDVDVDSLVEKFETLGDGILGFINDYMTSIKNFKVLMIRIILIYF